MSMGFLYYHGEEFSPFWVGVVALWNAAVLALWAGSVSAAAFSMYKLILVS